MWGVSLGNLYCGRFDRIAFSLRGYFTQLGTKRYFLRMFLIRIGSGYFWICRSGSRKVTSKNEKRKEISCFKRCRAVPVPMFWSGGRHLEFLKFFFPCKINLWSTRLVYIGLQDSDSLKRPVPDSDSIMTSPISSDFFFGMVWSWYTS